MPTCCLVSTDIPEHGPEPGWIRGGERGQGTKRWEEAYRRQLADLMLRRVRIAIPLIISFALVEELVQGVSGSPLWDELRWVRLGVIATLLAVWVLSYRPGLRSHGFLLSLVGVGVVAGDAASAIAASGGFSSPFQTNLSLLLVGIPLFLPYSPAQMAVVLAVGWACFGLPVFTGDVAGSWRLYDFQINAFLLACASALALAAGTVTSRLRRREFMSRQALAEEETKSERLLLNILPEPIARRLKEDDQALADNYPEVTVLFADIAGFTRFSAGLSAEDLVVRLNELFSSFDDLTEKHGVEKIKTIGDAYMAAAGLPMPQSDHAERIAGLALDMLEAFDRFVERTGADLGLRIGINTGPVVAGVIGWKKFIYDLWGDTVNTASRMESHGLPGRIQVTEATRARLAPRYAFETRGPIDVRGKGEMVAHLLVGRA